MLTAQVQSFQGILKNGLIYHRRYVPSEQATQDITEQIEVFYNPQRRPTRLGNLFLIAHERRLYAGHVAER